MATTSLSFDIFARDRASKTFDKVGRSIGDTEQKTHRLGSAMKNMAKVAAVAGAAALIKFGAESVKSLARIERINAQTTAAIKSTGGAAGVSAKYVESLAGKLERLTATEAETVQEGANLLLTFTNIQNKAGKGNKIFDQATKIMVDMSRALGQDTKSSAIQLGKALNDPIKGVTALQRVGVSFTADQKDQIKTLVESGKTMQAQKLILGELNKEFGGSGKAYAKTFAGQVDLAKHAVGAAGEAMMKGLLPALTAGAKAIPPLVQKITNIVKWMGDHKGIVIAVGSALVGLWATMKVGTLVMAAQAAGGIVPLLKSTKLVAGATKIWAAVQWAMNAALTANPIGLVVVAIAALVGGLILAYKKSDTFRAIVQKAFDGVKVAAEVMGKALKVVWGWIKDLAAWVKDKFTAAFKIWFNIVSKVATAVIKIWAWLVDKLLLGASKILGGLEKIDNAVGGKLPGNFKKAREAVDKFRSNVKDNSERVVGKIRDVTKAINGIPKKVETKQLYDARDARAKLRDYSKYVNERLGKIKDEEIRIQLSAEARRNMAILNSIVNGRNSGWSSSGPGLATGGPVFGPGTSTSDSIPARLSAGEHVWTAKEVMAAGGHKMMMALRRMALRGEIARHGDPAAFAAGGEVALRPRHAQSGIASAISEAAGVAAAVRRRYDTVLSKVVNRALAHLPVGTPLGYAGDMTPAQAARGIAFAKRQSGKPYVWGGVGPGGYDCSGIQSAVLRAALGYANPYVRMGSTGTMPWSGMGRGPGRYTIGWFSGSPGHMSGNMYGMGVESAGGVGVRLGRAARSPKTFPRMAHYDQGGLLMPGWTLAYNGTGAPERVTKGDGKIEVRVFLDGRELHQSLLRVKRKQGGASLGLD